MKAIARVVLAGACFAAIPTFAADDALRIGQAIYYEVNTLPSTTQDPVARSLASCLENGESTAGMSKCYREASARYDAVLSRVYQTDLQSASGNTKEALRHAQRRWLAFRQAEQNLHARYAEGRGTVMVPIIGESDLSAVRDRIAELMMYTGFREE